MYRQCIASSKDYARGLSSHKVSWCSALAVALPPSLVFHALRQQWYRMASLKVVVLCAAALVVLSSSGVCADLSSQPTFQPATLPVAACLHGPGTPAPGRETLKARRRRPQYCCATLHQPLGSSHDAFTLPTFSSQPLQALRRPGATTTSSSLWALPPAPPRVPVPPRELPPPLIPPPLLIPPLLLIPAQLLSPASPASTASGWPPGWPGARSSRSRSRRRVRHSADPGRGL